MQIEQETLVEIVVSVVGVGVFIAALVLLGVFFTQDGLTDQGAFVLIGIIVGFILLMTGTGYWLSGRE